MTEVTVIGAKLPKMTRNLINIKMNQHMWLLNDSKMWWRVRRWPTGQTMVLSIYMERKNGLKKGSLMKNLKNTLSLGNTKRKTSMWDSSLIPYTDAEYPAKGEVANRIYDLNILDFVKFAYMTERLGDLSLVKGSCVTALETCSNGWMWQLQRAVGPVPFQQHPEEVGSWPPSSKLTQLAEGLIPCVLHVVHKVYLFSLATEKLKFEKGETVKVIEKPGNDQERWKCKNAWGQAGLPPNYVVVLSHGPALSTLHAPYISYPGRGSGCFADREWYYGNTHHQARCVLNRGAGGDILIGEGESSPSDLVSLIAPGKNEHYKLQLVKSVNCITQQQFPTMDLLKGPHPHRGHGEKLYLIRALQ
uniref:SH3 domain-containing protein n=1 Tax=Myotis lucifugus TaxID=59463 RepID=G1Q351_MYOLU